MRPVSETPTEPADYAALSTVYGALLGATALSARRREPVPRAEVPILAAATFALSKLIVKEKAESWLRQPFVDEEGTAAGTSGSRPPAGSGGVGGEAEGGRPVVPESERLGDRPR